MDELISKMKIHSANNMTDKRQWVINMSSRQLSQFETDLLMKGLNLSITPKALPNKDTIAAAEDAVKDFE